MRSQVFINLAVKDLSRSAEFYQKMGFTINPQFSDDSAKCLVWSEEIFLMIMTHERFRTFATKPISDTKNNLAALFALSVGNVAQVHKITEAALAAGGTEPRPFTDHGFMQIRVVEDFDGHTW